MDGQTEQPTTSTSLERSVLEQIAPVHNMVRSLCEMIESSPPDTTVHQLAREAALKVHALELHLMYLHYRAMTTASASMLSKTPYSTAITISVEGEPSTSPENPARGAES